MAGQKAARPGGKNPEDRVGARNREKILRAAVDVFARKGLDGTRIQEIADQCGLPKANVYYYFSTKQEIYTQVIEHLLTGWDKAFEHITPDRDPREAIAVYVRAKLDYSRKHAAESRFFANEMLRGAHFLSKQQKLHMQRVTRERSAVVESWVRDGKMAPVDARHFFIMLWAATQFYGDFEPLAANALEKSKLAKADYDAAAAAITAIVLDGCGVSA
jgi:TetR/AcrR family transcriptional regulator